MTADLCLSECISDKWQVLDHICVAVIIHQIEEWNLENYDKRFAIIYDRFINIWKYPSVEIPEEESTEEQSIFDAESPKSQTLDYFIFENTKVEESAVAQMYFYVIKELFKKNTQLLINNQEVIKSSKSKSDFRSPQETINGYFVRIHFLHIGEMF